MLYVRSFIFAIGQAAFAVFFCLTGLLFAFFPYPIRYRYITLFSHFTIWWAKVVCGIRYEISGLENLPPQSGILLCKHQSTWETLFLQVLLGRQSWVLKRELLQIPFFGWGLRLLKPIAIDRSKSTGSLKQLIEQGKVKLDQGNWVVLFPEGSRIAIGAKSRYSRSGAGLAHATGATVVCVAHNAGLFWPHKSFIKYPGTVKVVISPPLYPSEYSVDALHDKIVSFIDRTSEQLSQNPPGPR